MHDCVKSTIKITLVILPVVSLIILALSVGGLSISLNPDVKWNEYHDEPFSMKVFYFNTLSSSLDGYQYAKTHGKYLQMLTLGKAIGTPKHDESWKEPIRLELYKCIGLISGALLLLTISMAVHAVTKQKLFTILLQIIACGNGIAGGYFIIRATDQYKDSIVLAILPTAIKSKWYHPEKEEMKLGYNIALYSAVLTVIGCFLILVDVGIFVPFGEGKWIWKKNKTVEPNTDPDSRPPPLRNAMDDKSVVTSVQPKKTQAKKFIPDEKKKKKNIITVAEADNKI